MFDPGVFGMTLQVKPPGGYLGICGTFAVLQLREHAVLNVKEMKRRNTHDSTWDILGHRPDACAKVGPLIARA